MTEYSPQPVGLPEQPVPIEPNNKRKPKFILWVILGVAIVILLGVILWILLKDGNNKGASDKVPHANEQIISKNPGMLAFLHAEDITNQEPAPIWTANADGSNKKQLTDEVFEKLYGWSQDNKYLLASKGNLDDFDDVQSEVSLINASTGESKVLPLNIESDIESEIAWTANNEFLYVDNSHLKSFKIDGEVTDKGAINLAVANGFFTKIILEKGSYILTAEDEEFSQSLQLLDVSTNRKTEIAKLDSLNGWPIGVAGQIIYYTEENYVKSYNVATQERQTVLDFIKDENETLRDITTNLKVTSDNSQIFFKQPVQKNKSEVEIIWKYQRKDNTRKEVLTLGEGLYNGVLESVSRDGSYISYAKLNYANNGAFLSSRIYTVDTDSGTSIETCIEHCFDPTWQN